MNRIERIKEIIKENPDFGRGVGFKICVVDELHDIKEFENDNEKLKETFNLSKRNYQGKFIGEVKK